MSDPYQAIRDSLGRAKPQDDDPYAQLRAEITAPAVSQAQPQQVQQEKPSGGFFSGVGQGFTDAVRSAQYLAPALAARQLQMFGLGDKSRALDAQRAAVSDQNIAQEKEYQAKTPGSISAGVGRFVGNLLNPINYVGGGAVKNMTAQSGKIAIPLAMQGGLLGVMQTRSDDDNALVNAAAGAAAGAVAGKLTQGVSALNKPILQNKPEFEGLIQRARREGIPLDLADVTDSQTLKNLRQILQTAPLTAMKEQTKLEAKKTAFNQAVGRQIGVQADALTPDVVGAAQKDVGEAIGRMAERSAVKPQHVSSLVSRLADIEFEATRFGTSDTQKAARNLVDEVLNKIRSEDGTIEGPAFRELNTLMGKLSAKGGDVGARAGEIGFALRQAMGQSLPQNQAKAWNALNSKYQNVLAVAPVAARSPTGDISGAGLLASVNSKLKRSKYGSNQDINELARMGKALVSDLTPNSGTAQKTMIAEMLSNPIGGLTQLPTIPAQMLLNNQALIRLLAEGPEGRKLLGPAIKGATYATMPLGGGRAGLLADDIQNATWRD